MCCSKAWYSISLSHNTSLIGCSVISLIPQSWWVPKQQCSSGSTICINGWKLMGQDLAPWMYSCRPRNPTLQNIKFHRCIREAVLCAFNWYKALSVSTCQTRVHQNISHSILIPSELPLECVFILMKAMCLQKGSISGSLLKVGNGCTK